MFKIDDPTAAAALPAPDAAGTPGYFTNGDVTTGDPATIVTADFLNMVQQELIAILTAGGIAPSKTTYNQVNTAIGNVIVAALASYGLPFTPIITTDTQDIIHSGFYRIDPGAANRPAGAGAHEGQVMACRRAADGDGFDFFTDTTAGTLYFRSRNEGGFDVWKSVTLT